MHKFGSRKDQKILRPRQNGRIILKHIIENLMSGYGLITTVTG